VKDIDIYDKFILESVELDDIHVDVIDTALPRGGLTS